MDNFTVSFGVFGGGITDTKNIEYIDIEYHH